MAFVFPFAIFTGNYFVHVVWLRGVVEGVRGGSNIYC